MREIVLGVNPAAVFFPDIFDGCLTGTARVDGCVVAAYDLRAILAELTKQHGAEQAFDKLAELEEACTGSEHAPILVHSADDFAHNGVLINRCAEQMRVGNLTRDGALALSGMEDDAWNTFYGEWLERNA